MTIDDAKQLKEGDRVLTRTFSSSRRLATVEAIVVQIIVLEVHGMLRASVRMRKLGRTKSGNIMPVIERWHYDVQLKSKYDSTTANVFADYLDEWGYNEAAEFLRKKFPIYTGDI